GLGLVDRVVADELDPEFLVHERDLGDECVRLVAEGPLPAGLLDPGELPVDPDTETLDVTLGVVGLPNAGVIDVSDAVRAVEVDQQRAVTDGYIAWHVRVVLVLGGP